MENREILFRGKRVSDGEWVYGLPMEGFDSDVIIRNKTNFEETEYFVPYPVNPESIGQFTGLTDKNGKKIFVGDIVKIPDLEFIDFVDNGTSSPDEKYEDGIVEIFFDEGGFCFNHPNTDTPCPIFYNIRETEVIGNIHDNPELCSQ